MTPKVRFALGLVAAMLAVTVALGLYFISNPIGISLWIARSSLERMDLEKNVLTLERGELVYYNGGSGRQTLVLLHGMGHQASSWVNVVPGLLTRYSLIVVDLPGHGESDPKKGRLTLQDSLAGVRAVLDEASPDVPVVLVGNSMGAWISMLYALESPERVERLVLLNGGGLSGQLEDEEGPLTLVPETREQAARLIRALTPEGTPIPAGFVLDDMIQKINEGPAPRQIAGTDITLLLDYRLAEIRTGADILWGTDDRLLPLAYGRRLHDGLPASRFHELEGCGHIPHQQCPGLFLETLFEALAEDPPQAPVEATPTEDVPDVEESAENNPGEPDATTSNG